MENNEKFIVHSKICGSRTEINSQVEQELLQ